MRIKFLKDACGRYNLCYEIGEVVDLPDQQAKDLIEDGYAEKTSESVGHRYQGFVFGKETAASKAKPDKR